MERTNPRKRGRPPGSTTVPRDVLAWLWVQVFLTRVRGRIRTGRTPSIRKACQEIANEGGIISAIGGNIDALVSANAARKKSWQRFELTADGPKRNAAGTIFANHAISNPDTLHARYSDAKKFVTAPRVRLAWINLARQMLDLPLKRQVRPHLGRSWPERD